MSRLPLRMAKQKDLVNSSVAEFLGCWAVRGKANLTLDTVNGVTTVSFITTLPGHPESSLHPPPPPDGAPAPAPPPPSPPCRPRHRGPAQRERNNQRAARHQAALAGTVVPSSNSSTSSTASVVNTNSTITASESLANSTIPGSVKSASTIPEQVFKCNHCAHCFKNEKVLKIHIGKAHKLLRTPEKERSPSVAEEPVLTLTPTPVSGREQEDITSSPEKIIDSDEPELRCEMCKITFVNNAHLKKHIESDHTFGPICAGFMHSGVLGDIPNPERCKEEPGRCRLFKPKCGLEKYRTTSEA